MRKVDALGPRRLHGRCMRPMGVNELPQQEPPALAVVAASASGHAEEPPTGDVKPEEAVVGIDAVCSEDDHNTFMSSFTTQLSQSEQYKELFRTYMERSFALNLVNGAGGTPNEQNSLISSLCHRFNIPIDKIMRPDKVGVNTCDDALEKFIALCSDSGSGIACPCLGFDKIKTLASTRIEIATLGDEVRTALDLKTCRQNYKAKLDLVKELLRATITGKTKIQQRRTALEKKEESKANKEEAKRKKDEIKGFWVIEVPINGENNFGIRTSIVPHLVEDSQSYLGFVAIAGLAGHDAVSKSYYEIVKKVLLPHKLASVPPDPKEQAPIATA